MKPYYKLQKQEIHGKCVVFYSVFKGAVFKLHNKLNNFINFLGSLNFKLR